MIAITIELTGLSELLAGVQKLESNLTRLKPLMEQFGQEFHSEEQSLFDRAPWTPLKLETIARKTQLGYADPSRILVATGRLLGSLTQQGAEGNVHRVSDDGAEFGSTVSYGIFHVPTRNPMVEPDEERYSTIAGEYAVEMVKEAFS